MRESVGGGDTQKRRSQGDHRQKNISEAVTSQGMPPPSEPGRNCDTVTFA